MIVAMMELSSTHSHRPTSV